MHMAGTLEHTAPETFPRVAADGTYKRDKYSQAADLWAVGAIFFQARPSRVCGSLLRRSGVERFVAGAHGRAFDRSRLPTIVDGRVWSDAQGMHRRGARADRRGEIFAEIFAEMRV